MIDCGFPLLPFSPDQTPQQWGEIHGETFREAIAELAEIRTGLLREKNPSLDTQRIAKLADAQWQATATLYPALIEELDGIVRGTGLSRTDLVILNNYTDFRDIQLDEQGCSLVFSDGDDGPLVGQTWDMHGSAKNYVCCLLVPGNDGVETILFSLVGCLGMMGFTSNGTVMGVNNINTNRATAGVIWPALVRKTLAQPSLDKMVHELTTAPVTSGHNYLLADEFQGQMWEVVPGESECVDTLAIGSESNRAIFHTNHCVGERISKRETTISQNSTTHIRYELLKKKVRNVKTLDQMYGLMNDHENYPKSICSNFQTNAQDPSITCGGAVGNLATGEVKMWRGDPLYDENFVVHHFEAQD